MSCLIANVRSIHTAMIETHMRAMESALGVFVVGEWYEIHEESCSWLGVGKLDRGGEVAQFMGFKVGRRSQPLERVVELTCDFRMIREVSLGFMVAGKLRCVSWSDIVDTSDAEEGFAPLRIVASSAGVPDRNRSFITN